MKSLRIEIKWAIIFSVMGLAWMLMEKLLGWHDKYLDQHMYLTMLFIIPAAWVTVLALKDKKKNYYHGVITYKQGLISGLILTVLIVLISPGTQWITSYVITPEYFPNVIKRSVELGYYATEAEAAGQFNYANYAMQGAIGGLMMGALTVAIAMVFLRTIGEK
jgi:hypothetical protein